MSFRGALSLFIGLAQSATARRPKRQRERHKNKRVFLRELKQLREVRDSDRDKKLKDARSQR